MITRERESIEDVKQTEQRQRKRCSIVDDDSQGTSYVVFDTRQQRMSKLFFAIDPAIPPKQKLSNYNGTRDEP